MGKCGFAQFGFLTVGSSLLNPQTQVPAEVKAVVEAELALINAHQTTAVSPLMSMGSEPDIVESLKEDYTQYIPGVIIVPVKN